MNSSLAELVLLSLSLLKSFLPPPCPEVLIFSPICLLCFRDLPCFDAGVGRDFVCSGLTFIFCLPVCCWAEGAGGEGSPCQPHLKPCNGST